MTPYGSQTLVWSRFGYLMAMLVAFVLVFGAPYAQTPAATKKGKAKHIERPLDRDEGASDDEESGPARREPGNPSFVPRRVIGQDVYRGLVVHKGQPAKDRGLIETGLAPKFADGIHCRGIDDHFGKDYSRVFGGQSIHGGIDIPVPFDTPVHAIAAGEVVFKALHEDSPDGIQIWLRHSPHDTGLPMWTFSQYAHLRELPDLPLGRRVKMGEVVGLTSNSGISSSEVRERAGGGMTKSQMIRRPAIHLGVIYNDTGKYYRNDDYIVPLDGWWMDPTAIYRTAPPYDSVSMTRLPAEEKQVAIPYMLDDGTKEPADTQRVWPYPCSKSPLSSVRRNAR